MAPFTKPCIGLDLLARVYCDDAGLDDDTPTDGYGLSPPINLLLIEIILGQFNLSKYLRCVAGTLSLPLSYILSRISALGDTGGLYKLKFPPNSESSN